MKVIFIPGNGGGGPQDCWFPYLKMQLEKINIEVVASEFPDNYIARESSWLPFLRELKAGEQTVLVGYSSGAIAAMRYAEKNKLLGSVLVGAYHTDMNLPMEKEAGYFDRPWNWDAIKKNQNWILQFSSLTDPCIPIEEARYVHAKLNTEYHELADRGHFGERTFLELFEALKAKLSEKNSS